MFALIALLVSGYSSNHGFDGYRYNPFQYAYPEYYLKAEAIPINETKINSENNMAKIDFFGLSSFVPMELFNAKHRDVSEIKIAYKTAGNVLIIHREKEILPGCTDEEERNLNKDFCSAFTSTREFYDKLYTFTPADLKRSDNQQTGNKWIVHRKGFMLENVSKTNKYIGKDFVAYESNYKTGGNMTKYMILFLDKTYPYYFTFATNISGDHFFKEILGSLKLGCD
jgi:hypothetical protein